MRFDLAFTMIDSLAHVTDEANPDAHFAAVAHHLVTGGCYVVELSHPNDSVASTAVTETSWTQRDGASEVTIQWGEPGDITNPGTGVTDVNVSVVYRRAGRPAVSIHEVVAQRAWQREEVVESLRRTAAFESVGWYGSFAGVALDDPQAWRMIAVLIRLG